MGLQQRVATVGTRDHQRYGWVMDHARRYFRPGCRALEVGPGDGTFAAGLAGLGYDVHGIDIVGQPRNPWITHTLDICTGALAGTFDLIHCGQVLEHIADPDAAMRNIIGMTHQATQVLISVPNFKDPEHVRTYQPDSFLADMEIYLVVSEFKIFKGNGRECYAVLGFPHDV